MATRLNDVDLSTTLTSRDLGVGFTYDELFDTDHSLDNEIQFPTHQFQQDQQALMLESGSTQSQADLENQALFASLQNQPQPLSQQQQTGFNQFALAFRPATSVHQNQQFMQAKMGMNMNVNCNPHQPTPMNMDLQPDYNHYRHNLQFDPQMLQHIYMQMRMRQIQMQIRMQQQAQMQAKVQAQAQQWYPPEQQQYYHQTQFQPQPWKYQQQAQLNPGYTPPCVPKQHAQAPQPQPQFDAGRASRQVAQQRQHSPEAHLIFEQCSEELQQERAAEVAQQQTPKAASPQPAAPSPPPQKPASGRRCKKIAPFTIADCDAITAATNERVRKAAEERPGFQLQLLRQVSNITSHVDASPAIAALVPVPALTPEPIAVEDEAEFVQPKSTTSIDLTADEHDIVAAPVETVAQVAPEQPQQQPEAVLAPAKKVKKTYNWLEETDPEKMARSSVQKLGQASRDRSNAASMAEKADNAARKQRAKEEAARLRKEEEERMKELKREMRAEMKAQEQQASKGRKRKSGEAEVGPNKKVREDSQEPSGPAEAPFEGNEHTGRELADLATLFLNGEWASKQPKKKQVKSPKRKADEVLSETVEVEAAPRKKETRKTVAATTEVVLVAVVERQTSERPTNPSAEMAALLEAAFDKEQAAEEEKAEKEAEERKRFEEDLFGDYDSGSEWVERAGSDTSQKGGKGQDEESLAETAAEQEVSDKQKVTGSQREDGQKKDKSLPDLAKMTEEQYVDWMYDEREKRERQVLGLGIGGARDGDEDELEPRSQFLEGAFPE